MKNQGLKGSSEMVDFALGFPALFEKCLFFLRENHLFHGANVPPWKEWTIICPDKGVYRGRGCDAPF